VLTKKNSAEGVSTAYSFVSLALLHRAEAPVVVKSPSAAA
jgi:hypothetical protein